MINLNTPISLGAITNYTRDEIHLTGGFVGVPYAVITFIPCNALGERISNSVATVRLEGQAYNLWYEYWNSEKDLIALLVDAVSREIEGISYEGIDLTGITVPAVVDEIYAEGGIPSYEG